MFYGRALRRATKEAWAFAPQALWLLVCELAYSVMALPVCISCPYFRNGRFYRRTKVIIQGSAGFVKAISRLFLTNFAAFTKLPVDLRRLELLTPAMQMRCSPN
jgi:hypothetical protein